MTNETQRHMRWSYWKPIGLIVALFVLAALFTKLS